MLVVCLGGLVIGGLNEATGSAVHASLLSGTDAAFATWSRGRGVNVGSEIDETESADDFIDS